MNAHFFKSSLYPLNARPSAITLSTISRKGSLGGTRVGFEPHKSRHVHEVLEGLLSDQHPQVIFLFRFGSPDTIGHRDQDRGTTGDAGGGPAIVRVIVGDNAVHTVRASNSHIEGERKECRSAAGSIR